MMRTKHGKPTPSSDAQSTFDFLRKTLIRGDWSSSDLGN